MAEFAEEALEPPLFFLEEQVSFLVELGCWELAQWWPVTSLNLKWVLPLIQ